MMVFNDDRECNIPKVIFSFVGNEAAIMEMLFYVVVAFPALLEGIRIHAMVIHTYRLPAGLDVDCAVDINDADRNPCHTIEMVSQFLYNSYINNF